MPKTYTAVPSVSTGDVYTAATYNTYTATNVNNLVTPPMCKVRRTSNLTSYVSASDITWSQEDFDTDGMFSSGTDVTIQTAGVYLIHCKIYLTCSATLIGLGARIEIGGTLREYMRYPVQDTTSAYAELTKVLSLSAGDAISVQAEPYGGSNYVVVGGATDNHTSTSLSVMWLGKP